MDEGEKECLLSILRQSGMLADHKAYAQLKGLSADAVREFLETKAAQEAMSEATDLNKLELYEDLLSNALPEPEPIPADDQDLRHQQNMQSGLAMPRRRAGRALSHQRVDRRSYKEYCKRAGIDYDPALFDEWEDKLK